MSLLWRSRKQRIALCPDRVLLSRSKAIAVEHKAEASDWQAAVDQLKEVLTGLKGHEVHLVIADSFVRYALLAYSPVVKSDEQWAAMGRHRFAALHGAPAAGNWDVKVTETAPLGARLACAVDRAMIESLAATFVAAQVHLASVQPFLVAAFNRIRTKVGNGSCWLIVEEPGRLTLAFIQRGVWVAVRTRRCDVHWRARLPEIIERESAFLALSEPCTRVIVCAQGAFDTEQYDAWQTRAVDYKELALSTD